jgi:hypothetical protein
MHFGNMPLDGGHLLFKDERAKDEFLEREPAAEPFVRQFVGAEEFIQGSKRYCLWLVDVEPQQLRSMPNVMERLSKVRQWRLSSISKSTQRFADTPHLFRDRRIMGRNYLLVPGVSSESRKYIPIGFMSPDTITSNLAFVVPEATLYHFGMLQSEMHMAWIRTVAGRLKSDIRYSKDIVYNNFPWPQDLSDKHREAIELAAQTVIAVRDRFQDSTLADLYDGRAMQAPLVEAHRALDRAVDKAYRGTSFMSDAERMQFLFSLCKERSSAK